MATAMPPPEVIAAQKAAIEPTIIESQIYAWCAIAVLCWEFLVTYPSEMRLIWPAPWTPMKVLYFLNRYLTLPFMLVVGYLFTAKLEYNNCNSVVQFQPYSLVVITFICDLILSVRTYALWGKNVFLGGFLAAVVFTELAVQSWAAQGGVAAPLQMLGITGCIWSSTAKKMNAFFAVSSAVVLLTFTLTTLRIVIMWHKTGRSSLLVALLTDGALYFAVVFAVSLLNLISFVTQTPAANPALHSPLAEVVTSIMCTRIILSTRRVGVANDPTQATPTDAFSGFKRTALGLRSSNSHGVTSATMPGAIGVQREVTVDFDSHDPNALSEKRALQFHASGTPDTNPGNMELRPMQIRLQKERSEWEHV